MQDINLTTTLKFSEITKQISKVINNPLKLLFLSFSTYLGYLFCHINIWLLKTFTVKKKITAEKIKILQKNSKSR